MFHVKHDQHSSLEGIFEDFLAGKFSSLSGLNTGVLPVIFNTNKKRVLVSCHQRRLKELVLCFEKQIGVDVACVGQDSVVSPNGFGGFYEHLFQTSVNFINSWEEKVKICLIDKKLLHTPLFDTSNKSKIKITTLTSYETLLQNLKKINYSANGELSAVDGSYVVRGGIVDIRPAGSLQHFRISFLQKKTLLYLLNNQGLITTSLLTLALPVTVRKSSKNILETLDSSFVLLEYNNNSLFCANKTNNTNYNCSLYEFDYQYYTNNKDSLNVYRSPFLQDVGFCINKNYFYIPLWFDFPVEKKQIKNTPAQDFVVGSYYTHVDFGICRFLGLEDGLSGRERICLQFTDGTVKIDVSLINNIYFYSHDLSVGSLGSLSKLASWRKTKNKAIDFAKNYVEELVLYYKKRKSIIRPPYLPNKKLLNDFVCAFKYQDTQDQADSWQDILSDLGSNTPMNRLLCGDVGFGKTEIAIRAAFVVAFSSKKTIIIAPTTILAAQLYDCFNSRLSNYAIKVDKYFRGSKKNSSLDLFVNGGVDVIVSTHAILKKTKALGACDFFIVDEEHRFGVKDKELVFKYRPDVDYLSLSATPIPRTLQMALSNIRNVSLIKTPPVSRKPIISQLCYYEFDLIKKFIFDEYNRNGQVYFVDNSVDNVLFYFKKLRSLYPYIRFSKIYGALPPKENEKTMSDFANKKIDVLFATTIIESGVDVSSVNTIIINNAYMFGLSQLYQLRGRVGRSSQQAFCYFLIPKKYKITHGAKKRLSSILKYNTFGSGYNLALSDLDNRGFGSLFGYGQSGLVGVGYEFYTKIIGDSLSELFNAPVILSAHVDISNGYIPSDYIYNDAERAQCYRDIFSSNNKKDLLLVESRLLSLYGFCHKGVLLLLQDRSLGFFASKVGVFSISKNRNVVVYSFLSSFYKESTPFLFTTIASFCKKISINYVFKSNKNLLNLECVVSDRNLYIFSKQLIKALIQ